MRNHGDGVEDDGTYQALAAKRAKLGMILAACETILPSDFPREFDRPLTQQQSTLQQLFFFNGRIQSVGAHKHGVRKGHMLQEALDEFRNRDITSRFLRP